MDEYAFEATGLTGGAPQQVRVENLGSEPHFVEAVPLQPSKSVADVRAFFEPGSEESKGLPPIDFEQGGQSALLDGGGVQVVDFGLAPGDYALLCFVADRAGGPQHIEKGMISEAVVR